VSSPQRYVTVLAMAVIAGSFFAACQAAPRQRPVEMGPVDKGPGSLGAVRKQLEGTWTLVSLETYHERGPAVLVKATGQLIYDQYGNLTIKGIVEGSGGGALQTRPDTSS
jgi:hypothetical protein